MTPYPQRIAAALGDPAELTVICFDILRDIDAAKRSIAGLDQRKPTDRARRQRRVARAPDPSPALRRHVLERDDYTCQRCSATGVPLHLDHIIPVAHGGRTEETNLQVLCASCNLKKGARLDG